MRKRPTGSPGPGSERQLRILRELADGHSQAQIANRIGLSRSAIDKELSTARKALGASTTFPLMAWYGRVHGENQTG
ncbi:helix-turn-helix domain-containing protein [Streptomyces sp. NPDC088789]|uniref:helix-turn-helix domain-containing protein n=1 Tax=Streptomyces sp. NPDC088789 TaxID=3365899 RepID=UPI003806D759